MQALSSYQSLYEIWKCLALLNVYLISPIIVHCKSGLSGPSLAIPKWPMQPSGPRKDWGQEPCETSEDQTPIMDISSLESANSLLTFPSRSKLTERCRGSCQTVKLNNVHPLKYVPGFYGQADSKKMIEEKLTRQIQRKLVEKFPKKGFHNRTRLRITFIELKVV